MVKAHRAVVNECCLVIRHLKLDNLDHEKAEAIGQAIDQITGVDMVSLNDDRSILNVAYDAGKVNIEDIEAVVRDHGADIAQGWWTRFKESWYRFSDNNVRENKERTPWSCH